MFLRAFHLRALLVLLYHQQRFQVLLLLVFQPKSRQRLRILKLLLEDLLDALLEVLREALPEAQRAQRGVRQKRLFNL